MAFAFKLPRMLVMASSALLGSAPVVGCIATDTIEFELDENFPPSVVSQADAEYPLNEIGSLDLDDPPPNQGAELVLETVVRDPNFDETLEYRIFINSPPPPAAEIARLAGEIAPSGFVDRDVDFSVPFSFLELGLCNRIELVVVGEFASTIEQRRPVEPGDFDQVTWWVRVTDNDSPQTSECE